MGNIGSVMMIAGISAMAFAAFAFDVSVPIENFGDDYVGRIRSELPMNRVTNIDLMSLRDLLFQSGGFFLLSGSILYIGGRIREAVFASATSFMTHNASPTEEESYPTAF
jgi:hypothetical protein